MLPWDLTIYYLAFARLTIKKRISSFTQKSDGNTQYFMFWMMLQYVSKKKIFLKFFNLTFSYYIITSNLITYGMNEHGIRNEVFGNDSKHFNCVSGNTSSRLVNLVRILGQQFLPCLTVLLCSYRVYEVRARTAHLHLLQATTLTPPDNDYLRNTTDSCYEMF